MNRFFDKLDISTEDTILVVDDFNMPTVVWKCDNDHKFFLYPSNITVYQEPLLQSLFCADLSQTNPYENYMGRLLDLVFANDSDKITLFESDIPMIKVDDPHNITH